MQVRIIGTCRGSGKIFTKLEVQHDTASSHLEVAAQTADGKQMPCEIYPLPEPGSEMRSRRFVLVSPILDFKRADIVLSDPDNREDRASFTINFKKAKWESRLNYRIHPDLCREIRDFDENGRYEKARFTFWECIADQEANILRGAITVPYRESSKLAIICLDSKLRRIDVEPLIMNDSTIESDVDPSIALREFQVSIRLPKSPQSIIFILEDIANPEFNSFQALPRDIFQGLLEATGSNMLNAQIDPSYPEWFDAHRAKPGDLALQATVKFDVEPTFSIVVPLFRTPRDFFQEMVRSVMSQSYSSWELILVNASPEDADLAELVRNAADNDSRIRAITLDENRGISENTNRGVDAAQGNFVCFLDHDDTLEPDCLFEYAKAIDRENEVDVLYCDEDKITPKGSLADPYFKPCYSIDLLRNNNYICHLLCIRRTLLEELERNTREFDGAQDHNMVLQAVERARRVHHVPRVLYHWRISESSTSAGAESKPYATEAGIRAVQAHLDRLGIAATVSQSRRPFTYKIKYEVPKSKPLVSIIIPTKDLVDILKRCLDSILEKTSYDNYEIILVENNSTEARTFDYYHDLERECGDRVRIVRWEGEFNFSKIVNYGAAHARGEYYLFLNNDTEVINPDWMETMLGICARDDVGVVGARLFFPDGTIQHAGVCVSGPAAGHLFKNLPRGLWGYFCLADAERDLSAVTAACMMTKRKVFEEVGGFTEELSVAYNDTDYCLKIREKHLLVVYTPEAELYHHESISRGFERSVSRKVRYHREVAYMNRRWAEYYIEGDPYINVNIETREPWNWYYCLRRSR